MAVTIRAVLKQRRPQIMKFEGHWSSCRGSSEPGRSVVAFQAHGENHGTAQQPRIRRSVRRVADLAAFHAHWRMLINKRAAFLFVAFDASFFAADDLFHHGRSRRISPRRRERTVWIMAIAAIHDAFVDAMLERHGELRAHIGVASVAQLRLRFRKQRLLCWRFVDGVATGAHHIVVSMLRVPDVRAG